MRFPLFIARRYFFSKYNRSAVNIISGISVLAFGAGTAALVIVLSVFNGFESLVKDLYSSFDAELRIEPAAGKFFEPAGPVVVLLIYPFYGGNMPLLTVLQQYIFFQYT